MRVHITDILINQIYVHARTETPNECCGLIVGTHSDQATQVCEIHPSKNLTTHDPEKSFEVDPKLRFDLMRTAQLRDNGTDIIGHYHSHPRGPAEPSATDLSMAYEPDMIWLICGLDDEDNITVGAFRAHSDRTAFEALELVIESV